MSKSNNILTALRKNFAIFLIKASLIMKNYDKANSQIKIALSKWPNDQKIHFVSLRVYNDIQDWDAFYEIYPQMEKFFSKNVVNFKMGYGSVLLSSRRYEDALEQLKYCIENWDSESLGSELLGNVYAQMAICHAYLGEWDLLEGALEKARKLVSSDLDISYGNLLFYIGKNKSEKILEFLNEQIKEFPDVHAPYYWKATFIRYYLHDISTSIQWYESALNRIDFFKIRRDQWRRYFSSQKFAAPWFILKEGVNAYVQLNNPKKALWLIYISAIRNFYRGMDIQVLNIHFDIAANLFYAAEKKCQKILKKKLSFDIKTECLSLLALAQTKQGKYDDAFLSANQAVTLNSENLEARNILAIIHLKTKRWDSAIQIYKKLIGMDRFNFKYYEHLGMCYSHTDELLLAKSSYEQAVLLNPFEADTWVDLADIYMNLGEKDLAFSAYKNGLKFDWLNAKKRQKALQAIELLKSQ